MKNGGEGNGGERRNGGEDRNGGEVVAVEIGKRQRWLRRGEGSGDVEMLEWCVKVG